MVTWVKAKRGSRQNMGCSPLHPQPHQIARHRLKRSGDRNDAEWAQIAGLMPANKRQARPGDLELVGQAGLYSTAVGSSWHYLYYSFPEGRTSGVYLFRWMQSGTREGMNRHLIGRNRSGKPAPSDGVIIAISVRAPDDGQLPGEDAGDKSAGTKRHPTDTRGHPVDIQDRDGDCWLAKKRADFPWVTDIHDGGYFGKTLRVPLMTRRNSSEIPRRSNRDGLFLPLIIRANVEKSAALLSPFGLETCSRLEKDLPEPVADGNSFIANAEIKALRRRKNRLSCLGR
uniref:Putative transposase n=1 Tax=Zymomonas mobilis TaxID=542 RepID=Q9ZIV7_ZYMMB|nr:putative transposase [Zymomonas mobilis subsp. mobilis ATCC 10988]